MVRRSHKQKIEKKKEFRKQKTELVKLVGYCMYCEIEKQKRLKKEINQELANKAIELFGLYYDIKHTKCYAPELDKYNFNNK